MPLCGMIGEVREDTTTCVYVFKVRAIKTLVSCTTQSGIYAKVLYSRRLLETSVTGPVHSPVHSPAFTETRKCCACETAEERLTCNCVIFLLMYIHTICFITQQLHFSGEANHFHDSFPLAKNARSHSKNASHSWVVTILLTLWPDSWQTHNHFTVVAMSMCAL